MSFTAPTRQHARPALPLAGMVDVLFLLIIFFMTTSVFREQERMIEVVLPQTASEGENEPRRAPVIITVSESGGIYLGQKEHTLDSLRATLAALAESYPDEAVIVRGDRASALGLAVEVMDVAYAAGLQRVMIATTREENGP